MIRCPNPLPATLVWAGLAAVAVAAELRIDSLDAQGRLIFRQIPGAESYQVEWSTSPSGPWLNSPPGVASIAPTLADTQTVNVGMGLDACLFRIRAVLTNAPATGLTNTFASGTEGWVLVNYPFRTHRPEPTLGVAGFDDTLGLPPGSLHVGDSFAETGIAAPASHLGAKAAFYGGRLVYDIHLRFSDNTTYPAVVLNGGELSVYFDRPSPVVNEWTRVEIPLTEVGWKVSNFGRDATREEFEAVLGNLKGLYIYTEWHTGADDTHVDNIVMTPP